MHHRSKQPIKVLLLSLLTAVQVKADPGEATQITLTRTPESGMSLQTKLMKNIFRTEHYQDTETYYVDVPYDATEEYTDYETQYSNDYVCHDVSDTRQVCHNEQDCSGWSFKVAGLDPSLFVPKRERPPGVGPAPYEPPPAPAPPAPEPYHPAPEPYHPAPEPYNPPTPEPYHPAPEPYHPAPEPYNPPTPEPYHPAPEPYNPPPYNPPPEPYHPPAPICHNREVCEDVPTTTQQCGYESVAHQVPVTRTRTVTRYNHEARTRTVDRTRNVFDHQWSLNVLIQFSADAALVAGERETFQVDLLGDESSPDAKVTPLTTVLGYRLANKQVVNGQLVLTLQTIARYRADDLKQATIQNLLVAPTAAGASYKFLDNAVFPRVKSNYKVVIAEMATHAVVAESAVQAITQRDNSGTLNFAVDSHKQYEVSLVMHREAPVLVIDAGVVDFEVKTPLQERVDLSAIQSEDKVSAKIVGSLANAKLSLVDSTENYSSVATKYVISLVRKNSAGNSVSMSEKQFSRSALKVEADGSFVIAIKDLGISDADISQHLRVGDKLKAVVEVDRVTADGKKIQFWKDNSIVIQ